MALSPTTITRAEFLKQAERFAPATDATTLTRWGGDAGDVSQSSRLTSEAAALAETARQLAYTKQVRARDTATVRGVVFDLEGETVELPYDGRLGMAGTVQMLVLRCQPDIGAGLTVLEGEVVLS